MSPMFLALLPRGRINRRQFWSLGLSLFIINSTIMKAVPMMTVWGHAASLLAYWLFVYLGVCIYVLRLRDIGQRPYVALLPFGLGFFLQGLTDPEFLWMVMSQDTGVAALQSASGLLRRFTTYLIIASAVHLPFVLWLGYKKGNDLFSPDRIKGVLRRGQDGSRFQEHADQGSVLAQAGRD